MWVLGARCWAPGWGLVRADAARGAASPLCRLAPRHPPPRLRRFHKTAGGHFPRATESQIWDSLTLGPVGRNQGRPAAVAVAVAVCKTAAGVAAAGKARAGGGRKTSRGARRRGAGRGARRPQAADGRCALLWLRNATRARAARTRRQGRGSRSGRSRPAGPVPIAPVAPALSPGRVGQHGASANPPAPAPRPGGARLRGDCGEVAGTQARCLRADRPGGRVSRT